LRVAVNQGGHLERVARAHFQQAQVVAIADNAGVRRALAEGRVDAALTNTVEAPRWAEGLEGVEAVGPFTRDVVALYVNAAESRLAEDVDGWLLAQEAKGTLGRWRAEHLGAGAAELVAQPVEALLAATAERLSLMPWVAAAKQQAGQPVEDLAQEAKVLKASREQVHQAAQAQGVPAPTDEALTRFFQAQMEAAKAVQRRAPLAAGAPVPSLEKELRPAVARISARMSTLVPRVPGGLEREATRRKARDWLATSGLTQEEMDGLADALVALGGR
jgi:cyclohexadienyl dehydratase